MEESKKKRRKDHKKSKKDKMNEVQGKVSQSRDVNMTLFEKFGGDEKLAILVGKWLE